MQNTVSIFIKLHNILLIFKNIKNIAIVMIDRRIIFARFNLYMDYLCAYNWIAD